MNSFFFFFWDYQAYCTLDGVPTDILISGVHAQNRAVSMKLFS